MKALRAWATAVVLAGPWALASAVTIIDSFDAGVTVVQASVPGFGSTTAAGINAALPAGDPTLYYAYSTVGSNEVVLNNQLNPGEMLLSHEGGDASSYISLIYGFSVPTDLSSFTQLAALGSGRGFAEQSLALFDASGNRLMATRSPNGSFGDFTARFSDMTCTRVAGAGCDLSQVVSLEFLASGIDVGYAHRLTEIHLDTASGSGSGGAPVPVTPIPEPSTVALMLGGLGMVAWMARRRRSAGRGAA
jgi:hypothetical protein